MRFLPASLFAFALAVRLGFCWSFPQSLPDGSIPDVDMYHRLALSVAREGSLREPDGRLTALREPGYPVFLAGLYRAAGPSYPALCLAQSLLGALTVLMVFFLGLRIFGPFAAWAAALMACLHPQLLYYASLPRRETLQAFLLMAGIWALWRCIDRPSGWKASACGALWGLTPLTNAVFLPAGFAAAWSFWSSGRPRRQAALFLAVFLGVYALWPARNLLSLRRFIPGMNAGWAHLYVGLVVPDEAAGTPAERAFIVSDPVLREADSLKESDREALFFRGSVRWIAANPHLFLRRLGLSFLKLWRLVPYPRDYGMSYRKIFWASLLSDGWIIPLGLFGMALAGRKRPEFDLFNLVLALTTLAYMVFWAVIRYRVPLMPIVFLYAGYGLERGRGLLRRFLP
jgi:4-amino-4-deoxy-L-arabinose transferase-like glycosyltransferase